mmetsp:Transcript_99481/g.186940  ORF Transcript_99481/g.186940 Transcript_99481/m.186940 type:complete len:215 (-) Transcript_99481:224-868(-)
MALVLLNLRQHQVPLLSPFVSLPCLYLTDLVHLPIERCFELLLLCGLACFMHHLLLLLVLCGVEGNYEIPMVHGLQFWRQRNWIFGLHLDPGTWKIRLEPAIVSDSHREWSSPCSRLPFGCRRRHRAGRGHSGEGTGLCFWEWCSNHTSGSCRRSRSHAGGCCRIGCDIQIRCRPRHGTHPSPGEAAAAAKGARAALLHRCEDVALDRVQVLTL